MSMHRRDLLVRGALGGAALLAATASADPAKQPYEHAYAIDFGAEHAAYIDAFFKNIAWDAVEARYDRAQKALAALG
jgi:Fe-Mn family superoxide dismutase